MKVFISLILAIVPAILILIYFYRQDKKKPEPKGLVLKIFFLGIASTVPAIILEILLGSVQSLLLDFPYLFHFFRAFFVAGLCEEFVKLTVVKVFVYRDDHFDEVMDGIVYMVVASLGFACMENILYVLRSGMWVAVIRAFTAVPMHALVSGLMGYYLGRAKFASSPREERSLIRHGLLIAVLLHGLYNFVLFIVPLAGFAPAALIVVILMFSFRILRLRIKKAIQDDIDAGRTPAVGQGGPQTETEPPSGGFSDL
jgi:RsiW-degrading membrane proteinase PrsW (M82 family)